MALSIGPESVVRATTGWDRNLDGPSPRVSAIRRWLPATVVVGMGLAAALAYVQLSEWAEEK
jgi:hypothetical protein